MLFNWDCFCQHKAKLNLGLLQFLMVVDCDMRTTICWLHLDIAELLLIFVDSRCQLHHSLSLLSQFVLLDLQVHRIKWLFSTIIRLFFLVFSHHIVYGWLEALYIRFMVWANWVAQCEVEAMVSLHPERYVVVMSRGVIGHRVVDRIGLVIKWILLVDGI